MIAMSLIWLISWATIVLGPPVTFAFYAFAQLLVTEVYPERREIIAAGKRYFVQSWLWMIGNLVVALVLIANYSFYDQIEGRWTDMLKAITVAVGLLWLGVQFYALPYLMLQEHKSLRIAWRNGLFTVLAAPGYTIIIWIFSTILVLLSVGTVIPLFLGVPAILMILGTQAVAERVATFGVLEREAAKSESAREQDER